MSHHWMDNFNIASMGENSLAKRGLERGGQMNLCIITQLILIQFYSVQCNNMIQT